MVNKVARQCRMHVDVTIRNSFGYDTPSLADTPVKSEEIGSFRINFGLILPAYVEIVCFTLNELAQLLDLLLKNTKAMEKEPHRIPGMGIEYYDGADQHKVKDQEAIRDILEYACFKIETGGKPTINSITRTSEACDLINKTAFDTYIPGDNTSLVKAFATSMLRLFMSMSVDKSLSTTVDAAHNVYMDYEPRDASLLTKDIYEIRPDLLLKLDEILKITIRQIEILFNQIDVASKKKLAIIKSWAEVIASNLHVRNPYLPVFLDISTEFMYYLILKQLENPSANPDLQDGDASDSEHEDDEIIGKKVVTHNGMRAILTPVEIIKRIIRDKKRPVSQDIELDVSATYFEVKQALDIMPGLNYDGRPGKKDMLQKQPDAVLRDNNACVNTETNQLSKPVKDQMAESDVEFWIVDITGSTQKETDELIEMLKKRPEKLLFLVSSGFKHEQSGGEKNPYGTVRVFAHQRNREAWEDAFDKLITCDKGLPGLSHHIRRMHKLIGNTPTNASIRPAAEAIPDQQEEALQLHENRTVMLEAAETHPAPKPPVDKAEAQDMEDI
jgi:hypothetical protein